LINGFPFDSADFADSGEVPLVRIRDILGGDFETFVPAAVVPEYAYLRHGDVVIGMDGDFNAAFWSRGTAALNQRLCLLRDNGCADTRFLAYALPSHLKVINDLTYATTVKHLSSGQVREIRLWSPDVDEQRAIADYLDRETARIDELIAEQQRLIELLRERRATVVDAVVWRGLADAAMAQSGIGVVGKAPAHWQRLRNKNLLEESQDLSENGQEELLSVSHLTGVSPRADKNVTMLESQDLDAYRVVRVGDLVINTMWAWMGALGVSRFEGIVSPAYGVYRPLPGSDFDSTYFDYLYRSRPYVVEMTRYSRGIWSSRLRIYPEVFLRLPIVVPPLEEQRTIVAYLDERVSRLDRLIAEAQRLVELAHERRAALITAVVTGQIDVRSAA
jgi:type I restriction enzyme S subunit